MAVTPPSTAPSKTLTSRGLRTKQQLVAAARTTFEKDGFAATRITDIADAAGVAHGTFYTYFDSKEEIFREVVVTVRESMLRGPEERTSEDDRPRIGTDPRESIRRANRRYLEAYRDNHQLMVIWEEAATINEDFREMLGESRARFSERAERAIRALQAAGRADATIDARYAAVALGAMVSKFAYIWFTGREEFEFEQAVEQLTILWCGSIGLTD